MTEPSMVRIPSMPLTKSAKAGAEFERPEFTFESGDQHRPAVTNSGRREDQVTTEGKIDTARESRDSPALFIHT